MCSFSGATCTSRVRHNADYVPYTKIRFDLLDGVYVRESPCSLTLNCNGDLAIRAYTSVWVPIGCSTVLWVERAR